MAHDSAKQPRCPICGAHSEPKEGRRNDAKCIECGASAVKTTKNLQAPIPAVPQAKFPQHLRRNKYRCNGPVEHTMHTLEVYDFELQSANRERRMVVKRDGKTVEQFSEDKLVQSALRAAEDLSDKQAGQVAARALWYLDQIEKNGAVYAEFEANPRSCDLDGKSFKYKTRKHTSAKLGCCMLKALEDLVDRGAQLRYFIKHKGLLNRSATLKELTLLIAQHRKEQSRLFGKLTPPPPSQIKPLGLRRPTSVVRSPTEYRCCGDGSHEFSTVEIVSVDHGTSSNNIRRRVRKSNGKLQVFDITKIADSIRMSLQRPHIDEEAHQLAYSVLALLESDDSSIIREVRVPRAARTRVFRVRIVDTCEIGDRCMFLLGAVYGMAAFFRYYLIHVNKHDIEGANQYLMGLEERFGDLARDLLPEIEFK